MTTLPYSKLTPEELLEDGPRILGRIDRADIFHTCQAKRELPSFEPTELSIGNLLGEGSFTQVHEIKRITAFRDIEPLKNNNNRLHVGYYHDDGNDDDDDEDEILDREYFCRDTAGGRRYDVNQVRQQMSTRYLRNGLARYAIKSLKTEGLTEIERTRGRIDLAIEVKYLSALHHPNIIKVRGLLHTNDILDPDYFFLMDRLYATLDERIHEWDEELKENRKLFGIMRVGGNRKLFDEQLVKRIMVAFDVASALSYLHNHKIIHRDVTADNVGFDVRGNAKIFDFGLATSLLPEKAAKLGLYRLTARTGSFPYMAPEVANYEPYNEKCDVYSFGILLWEILALRGAFGNIQNKKEFYEKVSLGGQRPSISQKWPKRCRQLLEGAFQESVDDRPSMKETLDLIKVDLERVCKMCGITDRQKFLKQQSNRSLRNRTRKHASFAESCRFRGSVHLDETLSAIKAQKKA